MPVWLQILLALGGSSLIGLVVADIYKSIKHRSKKHIEQIKRDRQEEVREVIRDELEPVKEEVGCIKNDLGLVKNGLQKDLYVDLVHLYNEYKERGYCTVGEKRDYDSIYWSYHNLGKNGVADSMHDTVMQLDETPKPKPRPRQRLNETKKK